VQPQANGAPQVCVVVVNWNGVSQSRRCLMSLRDLDYPNVKACLVDNGSTDGSAAELGREFSEVDVLALPSNIGYAGGCNAGIAWAREHGAEYIWLLNNDTTFDPQSLRALTTRASELRGSGAAPILAPKILFASAPTTVWSAGGTLRWPWLEREHIGMGEEDESQDAAREIDWASGCALFFPASVADAVGPLDERYFLYLEDVDWCLRARRLGIPIWFVPEARLWHDVSLSTKEVDSRDLRYYFARNYYILAFDHCGPVGRAWVAVRIGITLAKSTIRSLLFPSYRRDSFYQSQTRAIRDFIGHRFGQAPYSVEASMTVSRAKAKEQLS
jgi:GT2 family glycosyltransferase